MSKQTSRRAILGGIASLMATPLWANAPATSLRPNPRPGSLKPPAPISPEALIDAAKLRGDVSYAVAELGSGRVLEASEKAEALPPASVLKAVTALYALDVLGPFHRFSTRVLADGPIENGILNGDLILVGGGDPTLDTDRLAKLVQSLRETGITKVTGRFVVYGGALPFVRSIDAGQPAHVGYAPAVSGISLNFNRVYFDWKRVNGQLQLSMEARGLNHRPRVDMARMGLSDRKGPVFDYLDADGVDQWSVARGALKKDGGRWLPVRQPELYAGQVFAAIAKAQGLTLPAPEKTTSRPEGTVVAQTESAPLTEILQGMLRYSTNITAEMVGLAATKARGVYAASLQASGREMETWATEVLGIQAAKFVDHSGLGDRSRLHAVELAKALAIIAQKTQIHPILKAFTMKDAKGRPVKDHVISVAAKTGTLNFVSGLAGYMKAPSGEELAFAIFAADIETRAGISRAARERPKGAKSWNRRAKTLQQKLIERWSALYAS